MKVITVALSTFFLFATCTTQIAQAQAAATGQAVESVEVIKATATVEKIDLDNRKVTLLLENGKHRTFKVDKSVQNLAQVKVGDRLKMSYTEELIILIGKSNEAPAAASAGEVGVAPKGATPGVVMVETSALSAKILAVDSVKHRVTLEGPDGKKKTVKLGSNAGDISQLQVGQTVDMVLTDSLVVEIVQ